MLGVHNHVQIPECVYIHSICPSKDRKYKGYCDPGSIDKTNEDGEEEEDNEEFGNKNESMNTSY